MLGSASRDRSRFDAATIRQVAFSYYPQLRRVKRFVDEHYSESLPLSRIAKVAGMEQTYFSRFFHQKTGVCYRDWLKWVRVMRAIDLMRARDLSITETAFAVGFDDLRTFERACARCTGSPPQVVKKHVRPC